MKNVLIADNQAIVRLGLATLIDPLSGFQVISQVDNGVDAYMQVEQGNVDILITELEMPPGESGLLTTKRVHDAFPDVAIMILSSCEDQALINQAIHNGAQSYIFKSSPTTEIVTSLRHLVDGERYLDNNIMITKQDLEEINYGSTAVDRPATRIYPNGNGNSSPSSPLVIPTRRLPRSSSFRPKPSRPTRPALCANWPWIIRRP